MRENRLDCPHVGNNGCTNRDGKGFRKLAGWQEHARLYKHPAGKPIERPSKSTRRATAPVVDSSPRLLPVKLADGRTAYVYAEANETIVASPEAKAAGDLCETCGNLIEHKYREMHEANCQLVAKDAARANVKASDGRGRKRAKLTAEAAKAARNQPAQAGTGESVVMTRTDARYLVQAIEKLSGIMESVGTLYMAAQDGVTGVADVAEIAAARKTRRNARKTANV